MVVGPTTKSSGGQPDRQPRAEGIAISPRLIKDGGRTDLHYKQMVLHSAIKILRSEDILAKKILRSEDVLARKILRK